MGRTQGSKAVMTGMVMVIFLINVLHVLALHSDLSSPGLYPNTNAISTKNGSEVAQNDIIQQALCFMDCHKDHRGFFGILKCVGRCFICNSFVREMNATAEDGLQLQVIQPLKRHFCKIGCIVSCNDRKHKKKQGEGSGGCLHTCTEMCDIPQKPQDVYKETVIWGAKQMIY